MTGLWLIIICFLVEIVMATSHEDSIAQCYRHLGGETIKVIKDEALYWPCPNIECDTETNESLIFWFKNGTDGMQEITTDERARVHHHGSVLYILPLSLNDTGHYITRWRDEQNETSCSEVETYIVVYEKFHTDQLYSNNSEQPSNLRIFCPLDQLQPKNFTWYKDFHLLPGEFEDHLSIANFSEKDVGIYTCLCTWEHHGRKYNSSGSQQLQIKAPMTSFPVIILSPKNNSVEFVDLGSKMELKCLAFFGINMMGQGSISWFRNKQELDGVDGYTVMNRDSAENFSSTLTINKVSDVDLQSEFHCKAISETKWVFVIITLKSRESLFQLVMMFLWTVLFFVLIVGAAKWCAVDLILFFRGLKIIQNKKYDGKVYDAYVIYQKDNISEKAEKSMAHFINSVLPAVLEDSCGFKLFIHGRDDLPGEDRMELTERKIKVSRRLIVVLTSATSQLQDVTSSYGFDWQLGLYQVLVQQEMRIILIQLGDMKDYSHLPLGLQHLLQKCHPLTWKEGSHKASNPNSHFWKQVRYMMPVPACHPSCKSSKQHLHDYTEKSC